jgi:hypothetical protein
VNIFSKYWHIPGKNAEIQAPTRVFLSISGTVFATDTGIITIVPAFPEPQRTNLFKREPDEKKHSCPLFCTDVIFYDFFVRSDEFGTLLAIYIPERFK